MTDPEGGQEGSAVLSEDELAKVERSLLIWQGVVSQVKRGSNLAQALAPGGLAVWVDNFVPDLLATIRHLQTEARAREGELAVLRGQVVTIGAYRDSYQAYLAEYWPSLVQRANETAKQIIARTEATGGQGGGTEDA